MKGAASPEAAPCTPLHRDADRNSNVRISAVVQVIAVVRIGDVNVIVVIPVIAPIFRPRVHETDPIALILEARVPTHNHEGETVNAESVVRTKVSTETVVRDAVAVISAALLPSAMVGIPVLGAMLLPRALLDALLFLGALRIFIAALLLSMLLLVVPILLRLLRVLLLAVPVLLLRLLSMLLLAVPVLLLRLLRVLLLVVPVLLLRLLRVLLLIVPVLLRLLRVLLLAVPVLLLRLLSMLFRFALLVLTLLLLGMVLFFVLLLVLCIARTRDYDKQRKNGCGGNSKYFHRVPRSQAALRNSTLKEPDLVIGARPLSSWSKLLNQEVVLSSV